MLCLLLRKRCWFPVITKGKKDILPYNTRNNEQVGKYHGPGIPAQYGVKYGGYTESTKRAGRLPSDKPPRKFN